MVIGGYGWLWVVGLWLDGLHFIFLYLPNGSGKTKSPGLVLNKYYQKLPQSHKVSESKPLALAVIIHPIVSELPKLTV